MRSHSPKNGWWFDTCHSQNMLFFFHKRNGHPSISRVNMPIMRNPQWWWDDHPPCTCFDHGTHDAVFWSGFTIRMTKHWNWSRDAGQSSNSEIFQFILWWDSLMGWWFLTFAELTVENDRSIIYTTAQNWKMMIADFSVKAFWLGWWQQRTSCTNSSHSRPNRLVVLLQSGKVALKQSETCWCSQRKLGWVGCWAL